MGFANPQYLWLLSFMPLLALVLFAAYRARSNSSEQFRPARFRRGEKKRARESRTAEIVFNTGMLIAAALMILALSAPYQNDKPVTVPEGPVQAAFVVDVSRSMAAEDYRHHMPADAGAVPDLNSPWGSRLHMAKYQMGKIMDAIAGNEVGVVTYTAHGFAQAVPSKDQSALRFVLKHWVKIGSAPGDGSNYASGITTALDLLKQSENTSKQSENTSKQKVIILFSDGGFTGNRKEITAAVERLKSENVKLVIVGIGTPGDNAIPQYENGTLSGPMTVDGKTVTTSYEEDDIRELMNMANADYKHIDLDARNQAVAIDWMTTVSGTAVVFERRMLDRYLAGAAYALIAMLVLTGIFLRRSKIV
ncbi:MAG: VWA domain-containing protein [Candidatus Melainabacteria bacterium]|nr:VWA domain-containing protein [Candidatus Melainabacteria bacterium]